IPSMPGPGGPQTEARPLGSGGPPQTEPRPSGSGGMPGAPGGMTAAGPPGGMPGPPAGGGDDQRAAMMAKMMQALPAQVQKDIQKELGGKKIQDLPPEQR